MPRIDAILITTVEADTIEQAEDLIRDVADGLADQYSAPFTGLADTSDTDNEGQRVFYLHSLDEQSQCGGAEYGWHLTREKYEGV
jgi:hypothetical protein